MIEIQIDTSRFDRMMSDFPKVMTVAQKRSLNYIGGEVASSAQQAFRASALRPSPWAPRKDNAKHPLLIKSGELRRSITWKLEGTDTVKAGSPKKYALYHQFGTRRMPARPFFPVAAGRFTLRMAQKIIREVTRIFSEELGKLKK